MAVRIEIGPGADPCFVLNPDPSIKWILIEKDPSATRYLLDAKSRIHDR